MKIILIYKIIILAIKEILIYKIKKYFILLDNIMTCDMKFVIFKNQN